jgi:hypothetical protein
MPVTHDSGSVTQRPRCEVRAAGVRLGVRAASVTVSDVLLRLGTSNFGLRRKLTRKLSR